MILNELGVTQEVTSPTFVIMKNYKISRPDRNINEVIHMDAYRLYNSQDAINMGIEDYFQQSNTLLIVEWPENIINCFPSRKKEIIISHVDENSRKFEYYDK